MSERYPSSILVGLYTSLLITGIYLIVRLVSTQSDGNIVLEMLAIFTLSILSLTLVLEFIVYRRLKSLNAINKKEIKKLKAMEAFRREFLGDVSHELKTPIFAIEGFIETLLDGALEDEKVNRKFLEKARKNTLRLSNLVNDIITISQIESGDLGMKMEDFHVAEMIEEVLDSLAYKFTNKGREISYKVNFNSLEDAVVHADRQRIEQVVRNLIDNAVKYGDAKGTVTIELARKNERKLLVKVTDNGPGIEKAHLHRLFERFYRVDKSRSRDKGGTGLGLAICKHFIEAHKEKIWVESELGKGSSFIFSLSIVQFDHGEEE